MLASACCQGGNFKQERQRNYVRDEALSSKLGGNTRDTLQTGSKHFPRPLTRHAPFLPGDEGTGAGGGQLLLLAAAALLGAASGYAAHEQQLGTRVVRFYRAGMAQRVLTVFVALAAVQGAAARPSLAVAAAAAAAATWCWLEFQGSEAELPAEPPAEAPRAPPYDTVQS